jgi:hypothetical protein
MSTPPHRDTGYEALRGLPQKQVHAGTSNALSPAVFVVYKLAVPPLTANVSCTKKDFSDDICSTRKK